MSTYDDTPLERILRLGKWWKKRSSRPIDSWEEDEIDRYQMIAAVCNHFLQGLTIREIADAVNRDFPGIRFTRQDPYALLAEACRRHYLSFTPPLDHRWNETSRRNYRWLRDVRVVRSWYGRDVAFVGARMLLDMVIATHHQRQDKDKNEVHVGFFGGHAMRALARAFAEVLREPAKGLPETIVFHAMAAGFDPFDPTTDPNSFSLFYVDDPFIMVKPRFVGLIGPALVKSTDFRATRELPGIKEAFAAAPQIDIVATSGSSWKHQHSALRNLMERSPECMRVLDEEDCVADISWRPISAYGPIERPTEIRALTLVELSDLSAMIDAGKRVLVMLAPCGLCDAPKGHLLACLLQQKRPLMSDLVVDSHTVTEMLRGGTKRRDH